jgi:hypothetical protein
MDAVESPLGLEMSEERPQLAAPLTLSDALVVHRLEQEDVDARSVGSQELQLPLDSLLRGTDLAPNVSGADRDRPVHRGSIRGSTDGT